MVDLVKELEAIAPDELEQTRLLMQIYSWAPWPAHMSPPLVPETEYLRGKLELFERTEHLPDYVRAISERLAYDWSGLRALLEEALERSGDQLPESVAVLVDSVHWALRRGAAPPEGLGAWLLDQIVRQSDLDTLGSRIDWPLKEVFKQVDKPDVVWLASTVTTRLSGERQHGLRSFRALGRGERISSYIKAITDRDSGKKDVKAAVEQLVALAVGEGSVGYQLPDHLRDVDPEGRVVPAVVVDALSRTADTEQRRRLGRVVGAYPLNSAAWRDMARPMLAQAAKLSERDRNGLFFAIANRSTGVWRRSIGAVSETHVRAVERAREQLEDEEEEVFRDLWQWRLDIAQARLSDQEELAKEERGE